MLEKIVTVLVVVTIIPVLLLQFLPNRLTVNEGTLATIKTWRGTVWALPQHMLSSFGKKLKMSFFALLVVDSVVFISAFVANLMWVEYR